MNSTGRTGPILDRIAALPPRGARRLVAIGGPPGAGKETLAGEIVAGLRDRGSLAARVPVDGFLLDTRVLRARGLQSRKGAPETFDTAGLAAAVARLAIEAEIALPVPEHGADLAIAGALLVGPEHEVAVLHGDCLCLDEPPWRALAARWDLSIYVDASVPTLRDRLVRRWIDRGIDTEAASRRVEENDLFNARRIAHGRGRPDIVLPGG